MKRSGLLCVSAALLLVSGSVVPAAAQTSRIEGGSATFTNAVFFWETHLEPPVPPFGERLNMVVLRTPPNTIHRVMLDRAQKVFFGYNAQVVVVPPAGTQPGEPLYRVTFAPLSMTREFEKMLGADAKSWKQLPAPRFPEPRDIRSGDILELALLTNDAWGQRMTEYVTVQEPRPLNPFDPGARRDFVFASGTPRDFTVTDAALTLKEPRVAWSDSQSGDTASGRLRNNTARDETSGAFVWVYVPNRGRFLLSLRPQGEFRRAGTVRGTSLSFTMDGDTYTVNSASRIAPGQAAFNLYVLHQPNWKPTFENANLDTIHIGAADRADYLLQSR